MPLHSTFSHTKRLVITIAKGVVLPDEMFDYLAHLDASGARPYGKIFDVTALETPFTSDSVRALAVMVRQREIEGSVGPIAVVVGSDEALRKALLFATDARIERPIRIFREQHEARKWLDAFDAQKGKP